MRLRELPVLTNILENKPSSKLFPSQEAQTSQTTMVGYVPLLSASVQFCAEEKKGAHGITGLLIRKIVVELPIWI